MTSRQENESPQNKIKNLKIPDRLNTVKFGQTDILKAYLCPTSSGRLETLCGWHIAMLFEIMGVFTVVKTHIMS